MKVVVKGGAALQGKTLDISSTGISAILPTPIAQGESCMVKFDVVQDGQVKEFNAVANAVYSVCVSDGFRVGFQFAPLSVANSAIVEKIFA